MKGYFNSIDELFVLLNENHMKYIVLRNFEELENENIFIQGHPDIDILCENSMAIVELLGAFSCRKATKKRYGDGTHYYVFIKKRYVSLDLRHLGDDYYCQKWEKDLLESRVPKHKFYIPDQEQLFYTMIYHAVFQKESFSEEYKQRLNLMQSASTLSPKPLEEHDFIILLETYMSAHQYQYVYPQDSCVPLKRKWHNRGLLHCSWHNYIPHCIFHSKVKFIELLVKIKHTLLK